ncbi:unnamed protein product, partial [Coregonus sp. 'balchen']
MKIRCVLLHKLRRRCFLLSLSLLVVCLLKLVYVKVMVRNSFYIEPYGITASSSRIPNHQYDINCTAIYQLDPVEIGKSLEIRRKVIVDLEDDSIVSLTLDCQRYIETRGYDVIPVSEEERRFPLAYSLVVHKNAPMKFIAAMRNLAQCFPNLFIASKLESVQYAHITRLNADLHCLNDLLERSEVKWKSNGELVSELRALNGANMLETSRPSELKKQRFRFQHQLKDVPYEYRRLPVRTTHAKAAPPHDLEIFIGSAYFVLSRDFVRYVGNSSVAREFLEWSADTYSPDEHFWATLVRIPGVPGEILRSAPDVTDLKSKTRLVKWNYLEGSLYPPCTGTHMRSVCIYGSAELRWLLNYGHWFANKFDPKVDPVLIKCLEEKLEEKRRHWGNAVQK